MLFCFNLLFLGCTIWFFFPQFDFTSIDDLPKILTFILGSHTCHPCYLILMVEFLNCTYGLIQNDADNLCNTPFPKHTKNADFQKLQVLATEPTTNSQSTYCPSVESVDRPVNFQSSLANDGRPIRVVNQLMVRHSIPSMGLSILIRK